MKDYTQHVNPKATSQTDKVPGVKKQKRNSAGGVSFKMSKWDYMQRFLILGTEGGTYYVGEGKLTRGAAANVQKCIDKDGTRAVDLITDISVQGRAANNDAAIFALAMATASNSPKTRKYALGKLNQVCRIGTHLFHFTAYIKAMRGFGRGLRDGLSNWYLTKDADTLAYQMLKYQQRNGWSHGDILRLSHPTPLTKEQNKLFAYAVGKRDKIPKVSSYAKGMRKAKYIHANLMPDLIRKHRLTREAIPTGHLNDVKVWEALLENMPMTALVRNLGKMASLDMHEPFSDNLKLTVRKLTNDNAIAKSRIHPLSIMDALLVYKQGHGVRGSLNWHPHGEIVDALEEAFYKSFEYVEPTGKNIMLALDVSGSMTSKLNSSLMNCREASAVLAMTTMRTEKNTFMAGFTGDGSNGMRVGNKDRWGWGRNISMLPITAKHTLTSVVNAISGLKFGTTDCALPMIYCLEKGIDVDAIVIYTDNETWVGEIHPWQALDKLQQKLGHEVKSIVVGMTTTNFSIAKPDYSNMLDVVGFDTRTPSMISEFIKG